MPQSAAASQVAIRALASHVPEGRLGNDELAARLSGWTAQQILDKTGIRERRLTAADEYASDLAVSAARKLFAAGCCAPEDVQLLVFCTQSPDYLLPTTACLLQDRLGLPKSCMAFDVNLGCSGYVYSLAILQSLLQAGLGSRALLLTADTYTKYIHPADRSVVTLFGDGATATLLEQAPAVAGREMGPFAFGTDGSGAEKLIVRAGACRGLSLPLPAAGCSAGDAGKAGYLHMDGPEIFAFALRVVPEVVDAVLGRANLRREDVDLYVCHQASRIALETIRRRLGVPPEKFVMELEDVGNTVSCTIPLALERCVATGRLSAGMRVLLVGFGVGYSWGAVSLVWPDAVVAPAGAP